MTEPLARFVAAAQACARRLAALAIELSQHIAEAAARCTELLVAVAERWCADLTCLAKGHQGVFEGSDPRTVRLRCTRCWRRSPGWDHEGEPSERT